MEPTVGIEPTTPALRMRCSAGLSYVGGAGREVLTENKSRPTDYLLTPLSPLLATLNFPRYGLRRVEESTITLSKFEDPETGVQHTTPLDDR